MIIFDEGVATAISKDPAFRKTPDQRSIGNHEPPLNSAPDYLLFATARQLVNHLPKDVCHVHTFKELYGGRLITDIIPEKDHVEFHGKKRKVDHEAQDEPPMRLHADDADHNLRAPFQLLGGVKNALQLQFSLRSERINSALESDLIWQIFYRTFKNFKSFV